MIIIFFHSGLFVWMLMVLLFGWWFSSCFVLSPVFFLLLFTYLGGGRGREGRGVEEEGRGGEEEGRGGRGERRGNPAGKLPSYLTSLTRPRPLQKKSKNWKIAIFLEFFPFCYHLFIIFLSVFIIFASSGAKILQKMENCNFPRVFFMFLSFFYHVSSFLLPVVQKFSRKMENCNFPRVFFIF